MIAEIACAHEGNPELLLSLIDAVADSGAVVAQLQIFRVDHQVSPNHHLRALLQDLELDDDTWRRAFDRIRKHGLTPYVFAYDLPSLALGQDLGAEAIKLSSADLSNPRMLDGAGASGLPVTLGTGASTFDEIAQALKRLEASGAPKVVLMHGKQNFPTALEEAHLYRIRLLQNAFGLPVGYQDHTDANHPMSRVIDLVALGLGAKIIEKHLTLDRSKRGTDHEAALEPQELRAFVERIRLASSALGPSNVLPLSPGDWEYRQFQKKALVTGRALSKGEAISDDDIAVLRAEEGVPISPFRLGDVVGRRLKRDVQPHQVVRWDDLESLGDGL